MVKEKIVLFQIDDIKAIRIQCNNCKGELVVDLKDVELPLKCPMPQCGYRWSPQNATSTNTYGTLLALKNLFQFPGERMTLRFEIEGDEESSK